MSEPTAEEPLTADVFRRAPATTQRVSARPLPSQTSGAGSETSAPAKSAEEEVEESTAPATEAPAASPLGPPPMPPAAPPLPPPPPAAPAGPPWAAAPGPAAYKPPPPAGEPLYGQHVQAPAHTPMAPAHPVMPEGPDEQPYSSDEFRQHAQQTAPGVPAEWGWRGRVRRMTGGRIAPAMSHAEAVNRAAVEWVQTHLIQPRTVAFVNPKGGATTTTSTLLAGRTLGTLRGGGVIAWDNNETRGTLGQRAQPAGHRNTARELLDNIHRFESASARVGDLGLYVRGQGSAHFDVLASDERPEVTGHIDANEVRALHGLFERFYKLVLIDTGNNMRAPNWLAAVSSADLLVVTTTVRQDSAEAGLWMLDALERQVYGPGRLKRKTITLLAEPSPSPHTDQTMRKTMRAIFGTRTRNVFQIPYDPALVDGGVVNYDRLSAATRRAWLYACAEMITALQEQQPA